MPTLDFLKDQADWGEFVTRNVDPRAPNNVTTRARRQRAMADRESYEVAKEESDAANLEGLAMRNRAVSAHLLGRERLGMARELNDARIADVKAKTAATQFKSLMETQEREDIAGFTNFITSSGLRRGTPGFADVVAEARMKFPAVPSALFDDTWKMTGSTRTPEEVQASIAAARALNPNATITATEKGTTITDRPPPVIKPAKPEKPPTPVKDTELEQLKQSLRLGLSNQMKADPGEQPQYEPGLTAIREKISAREKALSGQGAAPAQSDKPKAVKQNGVIYHLQADGSYK